MIESAEEFVRLRSSRDPEEYNRAAHDQASEQVWLAVVEEYPEMRFWVAHNKTVPLSILRLLACDEDDRVRFGVAMKRKLDMELFELLAADPDSSVRHAIAMNAKVPLVILQRLADDIDEYVAESAQGRLVKAGGPGR